MATALFDAARPARARSSASAAVRTGRVLSALVVLFLGMNAAVGLLARPEAVAGTRELGLDPALLLPLGLIQVACLVLYLIPRTAPLGAVLWTGWLGGAIATHLRLGTPVFTHLLFPLYVAAPLWIGLWLRDARVRAALGPTR
jgi:hypothetical protein